ncbi:PKD domain-containing protein [Dyadobacter alkalitolerans]|uniref:PKD domain-containing protein n=1 Tax=Dyadobacter alkalitolerans TaxID=492736 RepID=UPI00041915A3|nr:PKD domain-containing protein [Dyadobacter alkalitolerans]
MRRILIQLLLLAIVFGCHQELPPQPVAKFTFTNGGCTAPCSVTFTSDSENATAIEWDFNDGTPIENGETVKHYFAKGKNYAVKLIAKSKDGGSSGAQHIVEVKPEPASLPEADFKYSMSNDSIAPSKVTFDNQSGNATRYEWDFGDPNATPDNPNKSTEDNPSHTYSKPGKYKVTLTVYNADGKASTKTIEIEVKSVKPIADFTFTGDECSAPCEVSFTNKSTGANTYSWDFGDGSPKSKETSPTHIYQQDGTYTVTLTVTGDGGTGDTKKAVIINVKDVLAFKIAGDYNYSTDIVADANGNIYICGVMRGLADFGSGQVRHSSGDLDFFVAKYSINGACLWVYVDGSAGSDRANSIALDKSNNVYITGLIAGNMQSGPIFGYKNDGFVAKLSNSGEKLWLRTFGGALADEGISVEFDQSNGRPKLYVTGHVEGNYFSNATQINFDNYKIDVQTGTLIFIVIYDAESGAPGPPEVIGKDRHGKHNVESMVVDSEGNAYLTGYFNISMRLSSAINLEGSGGTDCFLAKWNVKNEEWEWASKLGGTGDDFGRSVAVDRQNNVYVAGEYNASNNPLGIGTAGDQSIFVRKYSGNHGEVIWGTNGFNNGMDDSLGDIAVTNSGGIVVSGTYEVNGRLPMNNGNGFESAGARDVLVGEINSSDGRATGKMQASVGGMGDEFADGLCVTPNGTVYLTGFFHGAATFNGVRLEASSGTANTYIVKFKN